MTTLQTHDKTRFRQQLAPRVVAPKPTLECSSPILLTLPLAPANSIVQLDVRNILRIPGAPTNDELTVLMSTMDGMALVLRRRLPMWSQAGAGCHEFVKFPCCGAEGGSDNHLIAKLFCCESAFVRVTSVLLVSR